MEKDKKLSINELEKLNKEELLSMIMDMQEQVDILMQEVNLLRLQRFGRKTEMKQGDDDQVAMEGVFNEAEAAADSSAEEEQEEETVTIPEHKRKVRTKGKQEQDLSKLRKEVEEYTLDEETLNKMFPNGYRELPEDISSQIEHKPAEYYVKENHVHVYCAKDDSSMIVRADAPKKLFGKGLASPSMVAGVANAKYTNGMPLYRIEQEFIRNEVPVNRQTMANWIVMASERYFSLAMDWMKKKLLESHDVIHCDETPMLVTKDGRKAGSKSYMWVYRSNVLDSDPVIIFDYHKTRHHTHPKEFLGEFKGTLVTDGYEAYHKIARLSKGDIKVAGCWVHANRKFKDAIKAMGKSGSGGAAGSVAAEAVNKIGKLFDEDNKLNELTSEERQKLRQEKLKPMVDEFFAWIKERRNDVTLKSITGRAITYVLNQEEYLRVFLENGDVPIENSAAERSIRPFCIGKKNWIASDTIHGAESSGIIYSIVETAKANNLKPYEYMKFLLEEIPKHMDDSDLSFMDNLMPWSEELPDECKKVSK